jgi:hypothetical protein
MDEIIEQEKILMLSGQSEISMQNSIKRLSRNPNHFGDLLATSKGETVKEGAAARLNATLASAYTSSAMKDDPKYMTEI